MLKFLMRKVFFRRLTAALTEIRLSENGFCIQEPFGTKAQHFFWNKIVDVKFATSFEEVIVGLVHQEVILKNSTTGWYELIQHVPQQFTNFDFQYANELINSLRPCGICGIVAVRDNTSIVCETEAWNPSMNDSEIGYVTAK